MVFGLNGQRYALPLRTVERVIRAVEVTPLPKAPAIVLGVMDVAGRILPVLDLRRRLGLPEKRIGPEDQFVIAHTGRRAVALVVDEAQELIAASETSLTKSEDIVPGLEHVHGVVQLEDGLVLIQDLAAFLSLDEERDLSRAMSEEIDDES